MAKPQAFMIGKTIHNTTKAQRPSPGRDKINPSGRQMRQMERDAEARITLALSKMRRAVLRGLTKKNAGTLYNKVYQQSILQPFTDEITAVLRDIALAGSNFGRGQVERFVLGTIKAVGDIDFDWELANIEAERWARDYGLQLSGNIARVTANKIQALVADWGGRSETINQLAARINSTAFGGFNAARAKIIAITETTRAFAEGNTAAWRESGVIEKRRWNTANDELVCPICAPLNGMIVGINQAFDRVPNPPAHPRCRCWVTPEIVQIEPEALPILATSQQAQGGAPTGTPVSLALKIPKSGKYHKAYKEALDVIDSVHGDGNLPNIPVKTRSNMNAYGQYRFFSRSGQASDIFMNGKHADHFQMTLAHEVGHFIDHQTMSSRVGFATSQAADNPALLKWAEAVSESEAYGTLLDMLENPDNYAKVTEWSGKEYRTPPNSRHVRYLTNINEAWARSYSQYIAEQSGNPTMLKQLAKEREGLYAAKQWSTEDFAPISRAIDDLFKGLGWMK